MKQKTIAERFTEFYSTLQSLRVLADRIGEQEQEIKRLRQAVTPNSDKPAQAFPQVVRDLIAERDEYIAKLRRKVAYYIDQARCYRDLERICSQQYDLISAKRGADK